MRVGVGERSFEPIWRMEGPLELGRVPLKVSLPPQRDKFPADGDHNLDSLPTLAMSAGALGALQVREGERAGGGRLVRSECGGGLGARAGWWHVFLMPPMPCVLAPRCADTAAGGPVLLSAPRAVAAPSWGPFLADPGARARCPAGPAGPPAAPAAAPGRILQPPGLTPRLETQPQTLGLL